MEESRSIFQFIRSDEDNALIILKNIKKMLSNRIYVDEKGEKHPLLNKSVINDESQDVGDNTYIIPLNDNTEMAVKIFFYNLTSIGKQSVVNDFINHYVSYKKIVVAKDFNNKIEDHLQTNGVQLFRFISLMQDIISHSHQPTFEVLSPREVEEVFKEYVINKYTIKKIKKSDPVVKYFGLKKGHVLHIVRPNPVSGETPDYRMVW